MRGVVCLPGLCDEVGGAAWTGAVWAGPDAVLVGAAPAWLTFWPACTVESYHFAIPRYSPDDQRQWHKRLRVIPPELTCRRHGLTMTIPALTALDLAGEDGGGNAVDAVLRSRAATLEQLWSLYRLLPNRPGNARRAMILRDSRDEPWSEGERELHRLLRRHRITGWVANGRIRTPDGNRFGDILFRREKVIVEFDSWQFHSSRQAFEEDRRRRNELERLGYLVLNFTWQQVIDDPDWVIDCILAALALRR